jgi:mercuric ion transport protein
MPVLDKLGSVGAVVAAAACPVCFPKLALIGALFGLGGLAAYEAHVFIAAQVLVALAMLGHILSFRQHRRQWLLAVSILGGAAFFIGLYLLGSEWLAYAGLAALVLTSLTDLWERLRARARKTARAKGTEIQVASD